MAVVWIPPLMRELTGSESKITASGSTIRQVIDNLEERYPGIKARLCEGDRVRSNISVIVDGVVSQQKMLHPVDDASEIHFLPAISGGQEE
jgi:molybdopterin synthase sulfur carrier subunit